MFLALIPYDYIVKQYYLVLIPYDYVLNENYTFEKYIIDFNPDRVNGYISQRREMVNLEKAPNVEINNQYRKNMFDNLFS